MSKKELVSMLNKALELEYASRVKYQAHVDRMNGNGSGPIMSKLKKIASDEQKHEDIFKEMINLYINGMPSFIKAESGIMIDTRDVLKLHLEEEIQTIDLYTGIMQKMKEMRRQLKYDYFKLEDSLRTVIIDEEEHVSALTLLLYIYGQLN